MVYEIITVSGLACIEFDSVIRIEQCDESVDFLFGPFVDDLFLLSFHHVCSCNVGFRIQPGFILKPQKYLFLKEHGIPSCTCLFYSSSAHNHHSFPA